MKKNYLFFFFLAFMLSMTTAAQKEPSIENDFLKELKPKIERTSALWGKMLKEKDISLIPSIYDEQAVYLPDMDVALYGIESIAQYWEASFAFLNDVQLSMKSLDGTREVLYETGIVTVSVLNQQGESEDIRYKYVNVWRLQKDGGYKVAIDIFNELPQQ